jgi:hypothetical protein
MLDKMGSTTKSATAPRAITTRIITRDDSVFIISQLLKGQLVIISFGKRNQGRAKISSL